MANTIITKNSSTASAVPTSGDLVQGELAVNVTDKRLFTENSGGTVVEVGTNPSTIAVAGNATVGGTLGVTGLATLASSTLTANPTLSAGTANGVAYLDGSKVLTSGSALTFDGTTFQVTGKIAVSGTNPSIRQTVQNSQLDLCGGTTVGTDPSIQMVGSTNSGGDANSVFQNTNTHVFRNTAGSSEYMRLTSTGLGIGTSSPASKLHVNAASGSVFAQISSGANDLYLGYDGVSGMQTMQSDTGIYFATGASFTERMRIDSSGNLGLGVTPSAWSLYVALQNGGTSVADFGGGNNAVFGSNLYYGGSPNDFRYIASGQASSYRQVTGGHTWNIAPSGTAGNAISFTQAMTLDADGDLGIGVTSPARKLSVSSGSTSATYFQLCNTTSGTGVGQGFELFSDGTNAGVINRQNGYLEFDTNNIERMRIDSAGNLGLGVTPSAFATVKAMQLNTASTLMAFTNEFDIGQNVYYNAGNKYITTGAATLYAQITGQHQWFNAPSGTAGNAISFTQAMTLDASGRLLLGTTTALTKATVYGSGDQKLSLVSPSGASTQVGINLSPSMTDAEAAANPAQAAIYATDSNYSANIIFANKATGAVGNALTERMRIDTSGNVGIGTTSPSAKLEIAQSADTTDGPKLRIANNGNTLSNGQLIGGIDFFNGDDSGEGVGAYIYSYTTDSIGRAEGQDIRFATGGTTERMRIDSSGNLLVGTTSSPVAAKIASSFLSSSSQFGAVFIDSQSNNTAIFAQFRNASTAIGSITNNNNTATAYNTSSDYRLKHDIQPMTGALTKVALLKPCTYKWNVNESAGEGFIAHELAEVCPGAVTGIKDAVDAEGNPQYQGIDTSFLVATLTAALQEQQAIIESLTARVSALEGN
jgi:hypothetical protein